MNLEKATFAAGCFWGVEAEFRKLAGVKETKVGYTGGPVDNPTYEQVCTDRTGHAEAVQITFDPAQIGFEALVETFFKLHDPTQINRQGPDVGTQYRTAVFVHSDEQREVAGKVRERAQEGYPRPIATQIVDAQPFWEAEDYHQQYLEKRGMSSCHVDLGG